MFSQFMQALRVQSRHPACVRCVHTEAKRTVPYFPKGSWKLPVVDTDTGGTAAEATPVNVPRDWRAMKTLPQWKRQMFALREKFPEGWNSRKKLSRDKMEELRALKNAMPHLTTTALGEHFKISPESVRRILRAKWKPEPGVSKAIDKRRTKLANVRRANRLERS